METERLRIRPWDEPDLPRLFDTYSRWEVSRWLGNPPSAMESLEAARATLQRWNKRASGDGRFGVWAVEVRETEVVAGSVLLVPIRPSGKEAGCLPEDGGDIEVGWHFHPDSWGKGYATEAARTVMQRGFDDGLDEILAVVRPDNDKSLAVCRRLEMEPLGRTSQWYDIELEAFCKRRGFE